MTGDLHLMHVRLKRKDLRPRADENAIAKAGNSVALLSLAAGSNPAITHPACINPMQKMRSPP
jgi:hypothetical protein